MQWFDYQGLTTGGQLVGGRLETADHDSARKALADMRLEVREVRETSERPTAAALTGDDFIFFNEQLASLAEAGIALDEGLGQLARDVESPRLRSWLANLVEDLRRGKPLDQALAERQAGLPTLYSEVVRAGVDSGNLPATLLNLNQHLRLVADTRRIIWETAAYPLVVAGLGLALVSFFFLALLPQFSEIYADFGYRLPLLTRIIIDVARIFPLLLLLIAVLSAAFALGWVALRRTPAGRRMRDGVMLRMPVIGRLHSASLIARFLHSVATATGAGISLPRALRVSAAATGSALLIADGERMSADVERGDSPLDACRSVQLIPPLFGLCIQSAQARGDVPSAVAQLARAYEDRARNAQSMLKSLLFPCLVLALGVLLGGLIIATFMPLVAVMNSVTG